MRSHVPGARSRAGVGFCSSGQINTAAFNGVASVHQPRETDLAACAELDAPASGNRSVPLAVTGPTLGSFPVMRRVERDVEPVLVVHRQLEIRRADQPR
jgi:hypothetical protein